MTAAALRRLGACALLAVAAVQLAWAGRPLSVEDAEVAEVGGGELESWYERPASRDRLWTTALGVGVRDWLELGLSVERNFSGVRTGIAAEAKMLLTRPREGGCNFGAVLGRAHLNRGGGDASYVNGLMSCDLPGGPLHMNLGAERDDGGPTLKTWGIAKELDLGMVTAHAEAFGAQHGRPTFQVGLRREFAGQWQIDGTVGRSEHKTVFSIGLRYGF